MPFIRFTEKATEGSYLLMTRGPASWFPDGIAGVTEKLLKGLEDEFTQRGIKYERLSLKELNQKVKEGNEKDGSKGGKGRNFILPPSE